MPILMGLTSGGVAVPVQVDANGKVVLSESIPQGSYGWFGGAWQKSPIPLGVSAVLVKNFYNENLAAGYTWIDSDVVPAGEIWIVTNMAVTIVSATISVVQVSFVSGAVTPLLWAQSAPVSGRTYDKQGYWVLGAGDKVRTIVQNSTLGNDIYVGFTGFVIDTDQ